MKMDTGEVDDVMVSDLDLGIVGAVELYTCLRFGSFDL
jgi:hypothetical protein